MVWVKDESNVIYFAELCTDLCSQHHILNTGY